jgi:monoterpene epsilon-lactone hydrolase
MVQYQYTENRPDLRGTLLSPARGDFPENYSFEGFSRTFMSYGDVKVFATGIIKMVEHLKSAGERVEVDVGKDQVHDYHEKWSPDGVYGRLKPFLDGQGRY